MDNFLPSAPILEETKNDVQNQENIQLEAQENIYDNPKEEIIKHKNQDFPDPSNHSAIKRFFVGMSYPFEALKLFLTKYYAVLAFFDSFLVLFVIILSLTLGTITGTFLITGTTNEPVK